MAKERVKRVQGADGGDASGGASPGTGSKWSLGSKVWLLPALVQALAVACFMVAHRGAGELLETEFALTLVVPNPLVDAPHRHAWAISWSTLLLAGIVTGAVSVTLLVESLSPLAVSRETLGYRIALGVGALLGLCAVLDGSGAFFGREVTSLLFHEEVKSRTAGMTWITNVTTASATVLLVVAVCMVLRRHLRASEHARGGYPAKDRIKVLLYVGAGMLLIGAIEVRHLYWWPTLYVEDATLRGDAEGVAVAATTTVGILGSLQLFAIFVPAFIVLKGTSTDEGGASGPKLLAGSEFFVKALEGGRIVLAVLAPLLGTWLEPWVSGTGR